MGEETIEYWKDLHRCAVEDLRGCERQIINQARNIAVLTKRMRDAGLSDKIGQDDKAKLG